VSSAVPEANARLRRLEVDLSLDKEILQRRWQSHHVRTQTSMVDAGLRMNGMSRIGSTGRPNDMPRQQVVNSSESTPLAVKWGASRALRLDCSRGIPTDNGYGERSPVALCGYLIAIVLKSVSPSLALSHCRPAKGSRESRPPGTRKRLMSAVPVRSWSWGLPGGSTTHLDTRTGSKKGIR
jgi:hypothetical protein